MGLLTTVIAATTEAGKSETPFFILGIGLALFAVVISVVGLTRPAWPNGEGAARGVIGAGATLVVVVMGIVIWMNA
jgi:hypothetical protein